MKSTPRFRGPSLILLAVAHIVVFAAGIVASVALRHGASFVTPFSPVEKILDFLTQNSQAVRVGNFFLFGSAVPLGLFAVTMVSRLRYMGVRAAGTNIALFGGIAAAIALFLSGIAGWILSVPDVIGSAAVVKAIDYFNFLCGGVFYAVGFGLLAAGVSITSHFMKLVPRWLVVLGMIVAIAGELSWFSLIAYPANFFIPINRYLGFIWMILAAVFLTKGRRMAQAPPTVDAL
ncbi:hypothetical protein GCM10011507_22120 [Edaphobacter acidisoli]|uniref:DUF4386 domain-containing protein n=1 Tax=Edaphobacter acidisoli TaxID=2040573 RepID=A0A916RVV6_9BACT|nr:hypothetical protein [Edaphobacter acidisoli]GGA70144.1 hypothetical protein GCM10011507_22120 [Edaphobacter acidisoli]